MNIQELIYKISKELKSIEHTWWLVQTITNKTKTQLLLEDIKLTRAQLEQIDTWIKKIILEHYPIQYLIGSVPFLNCEILVERPVLIPRPETEEWCAKLVEKLKLLNNQNINILDMCTGSGCIAVALAKNLSQAHITSVDISDKAIELTQKNIVLNKISNVAIIKSDLFENLDKRKFDIIVSNPPYIDEELYKTLDPSVKNWEDKNALISQDQGFFLIKRLINQAPDYLKFNSEFKLNKLPNLIIEIDENQGLKAKNLMLEASFKNVKVKKDLYNRHRVISGLKIID